MTDTEKSRINETIYRLTDYRTDIERRIIALNSTRDCNCGCMQTSGDVASVFTTAIELTKELNTAETMIMTLRAVLLMSDPPATSEKPYVNLGKYTDNSNKSPWG